MPQRWGTSPYAVPRREAQKDSLRTLKSADKATKTIGKQRTTIENDREAMNLGRSRKVLSKGHRRLRSVAYSGVLNSASGRLCGRVPSPRIPGRPGEAPECCFL